VNNVRSSSPSLGGHRRGEAQFVELMVPLLIGTSWLLVVSLVFALCAAARDGDRQQAPARSTAARRPARYAGSETSMPRDRAALAGRVS
jgi:hypothetical protein